MAGSNSPDRSVKHRGPRILTTMIVVSVGFIVLLKERNLVQQQLVKWSSTPQQQQMQQKEARQKQHEQQNIEIQQLKEHLESENKELKAKQMELKEELVHQQQNISALQREKFQNLKYQAMLQQRQKEQEQSTIVKQQEHGTAIAALQGQLQELLQKVQHLQPVDKVLTDESESGRESAYWDWILQQRNASNDVEDPAIFKIRHRGVAGLGHDLTRWACAYHFAKALNITVLWLEMNPYCKGTIFDLPEYLLGKGPLVVPPRDQQLDPTHQATLPKEWPPLRNHPGLATNATKKFVHVNNEVFYYTVARPKDTETFYGKHETDVEFYNQFMHLFQLQHGDRIRKVTQEGPHGPWRNHTVIGLHVRAGNGETGDFARKGRQQGDLDTWIHNVADLLHNFVKEHPKYFADQNKKPLLFVATDTQHVLEEYRQYSARKYPSEEVIPAVSAVSSFLKAGSGVVWDGKGFDKGEDCMIGWMESVLDSYLLSTQTHMVLAGQVSSFSGTAPLTLITEKARKQKMRKKEQLPNYFCSVGKNGDRLDCFDSITMYHFGNSTKVFGNTNSPSRIPPGGEWGIWPHGDGEGLKGIFEDSPIFVDDTATAQ